MEQAVSSDEKVLRRTEQYHKWEEVNGDHNFRTEGVLFWWYFLTGEKKDQVTSQLVSH